MNNEPVAWISVLGVDLIGQKFTDVRVSLTKTDVASIPLYTHPVELTDDEIDEIANQYLDWIPCGHSEKIVGVIDFARAILRKAQEK